MGPISMVVVPGAVASNAIIASMARRMRGGKRSMGTTARRQTVSRRPEARKSETSPIGSASSRCSHSASAILRRSRSPPSRPRIQKLIVVNVRASRYRLESGATSKS